METALSTIQLLPDNRQQQKTFVNSCIEELVNGNNDPARIYAKLRIIGDAIKDILDSPKVKEVAIEEARKYPEGYNVAGAKVSVVTKRDYDFSVCNDFTLGQYEADAKFAKEHIAERKKFLQSLKPGMIAFDERTGAELVAPIVTENVYITVK